jgi:hypothetical protein
MDPYIRVCKERNFSFDNIFYEDYLIPTFSNSKESIEKGDVEVSEEINGENELKKLIEQLSEFKNRGYMLQNDMFESYDNIVLSNLDAVFGLSGIKYNQLEKIYDNSLDLEYRFCEIGSLSMCEYFMWRLTNVKGFSVFKRKDIISENVSSKIYSKVQIINEPLNQGNKKDEEIMLESVVRNGNSLNLVIVNKRYNHQFILNVIDKCLIPIKGNCVISFENYPADFYITLISMFEKSALISPLSSDKLYLVLLGKKESGSIGRELNVSKLNNYFSERISLIDKREIGTLYYLYRANIHFCIH